jgi:probable addiction module antidote protein
MTLKTTRWDSAEYLQTDEDIAAYLDAALEEDDPALVTYALGVITRAKDLRLHATLPHA